MILHFKEKKRVNISLLSGPDTHGTSYSDTSTRQGDKASRKREEKNNRPSHLHMYSARGAGGARRRGWMEQTVFLGSTGLVCER